MRYCIEGVFSFVHGPRDSPCQSLLSAISEIVYEFWQTKLTGVLAKQLERVKYPRLITDATLLLGSPLRCLPLRRAADFVQFDVEVSK